MLIHSAHGSEFCSGAIECDSRPASERDRISKLFISIEVGNYEIDVVIDTGGVYLILDAVTASELDLDPEERLERETLWIRGVRYDGSLYRLTVRFPAIRCITTYIEDIVYVYYYRE